MYEHKLKVKTNWDFSITYTVGTLKGQGKTNEEAKRDAFRQAIDLLIKYIRGKDYGTNPERNSEYHVALLELAKLKAFIDEYSATNCIGYGGVFPWGGICPYEGERAELIEINRSPSDPKFKAFIEKKIRKANGGMFSFTTVAGYGFKIAAYAYGRNKAEARFRYLTKVAERMALLIRRETDDDMLYDLQEASDKLDRLLSNAKTLMLDYEHISHESIQDILDPEKSWRTAPQFKPGTVIETPASSLENS